MRTTARRETLFPRGRWQCRTATRRRNTFGRSLQGGCVLSDLKPSFFLLPITIDLQSI